MNLVSAKETFGKIAAIASRLISVVALVWFGCIVAQNAAWLTDDNDSAEQAGIGSDSLGLTSLIAFSPGHWVFDGTAISMQQNDCSDEQLRDYWNKIQMGQMPAPNPKIDAERLIELARSNGATKQDWHGGDVWSLDSKQVQLRLFVTAGPTPQLIAGGFAVRNQTGWQLTGIGSQQATDQRLLPMPPDARLTCSRHSESGRLQFQLLMVSDSKQQLVERWRSEGWQVQPTPWDHSHILSYLCYREGETIYAWSRAVAGKRVLMLSRPDDGGDASLAALQTSAVSSEEQR